jgi:hypothetical protein
MVGEEDAESLTEGGAAGAETLGGGPVPVELS